MGSIKANGLYAAYLRKSRRDMEMEALGQGETLARHEKQLSNLADRLGIRVSRWYREIVSGDTIAERPQVRQLLEDVGAGLWDGVLVVDVDRLGRGDSIDQGVIMQTFLYAGVLIVTPDKTYDPADDSDAEFFEIKLFFSRREYSMIKKRMQRGRLASAMDGCYMGSRPVYGYERVKLQGRKGWSLKVVPEKAAIVQSVFSWYAYGMDGREVGAAVIADKLNGMGLRTDLGHRFEPSYIRHMLQNPAYIGKVQWNQRTTQYAIRDGKRVSTRPRNDDALLVDGHHEPIIDRALFDRIQQMFAAHEKRPKNKMAQIANPLAGLVICAQCGRMMQYKGDRHRRNGLLGCVTQHCPTAGTYIDVVEGVVLDGLRAWVNAYEARDAEPAPAPSANASATDAARAQLTDQLTTLEGQSGRLFDLLEQGVYDVATFRDRRADLESRIGEVKAALAALDAPPPPDPVLSVLSQVRTVLGAYNLAATPAEKNALLRTVLDHISYEKTQRCQRNNAPTDHLSLTLFPRVPETYDEGFSAQNSGSMV